MVPAADRCSKPSLREVVGASAVTRSPAADRCSKSSLREVVGASAVTRSPAADDAQSLR